MTQTEKEALRDYIVSYLIANSQTINGLPDVTSLDGISSFPVVQQQEGNRYIAKKVPFNMMITEFRYNSGYIQYKDLINGTWINIMSFVELAEDLDLSRYVNVDMDQIVNGIKTFNNSPIVPDPITSQQVTNKGYVDSSLLLKVDKTSKIISGDGLIGGGDLSSDLTINIESANDGILINPDNIQLQTVDNLNGLSSNKPLSSLQGKILNETKIDIDGLNSNISKLHFNTDTLSQLTNIGDVRYSPESKTIEVKVSDAVSLQLGQEMQIRVKNDEVIQINNGQMVYINSAVGANPLAKLASTSNADVAQKTFGMATENIPANGFGAITTEGLVRDINTSAFPEGAMLWLGTNGSVTNIEPVAPVSKISVGMVLRSNASNGIVYVKIRAIERSQKLSDVYAPTLTSGDVLRWNGTAQRFETYNLSNKADLVDGKVMASQLPSYVDDVLEYANFSSFPVTGESGKIYVDLQYNLVYRWSGSIYTEISKSLALGETSNTAFRGDYGQAAYQHANTDGNPHNTVASEIGNTPTGGLSATTVQGAINELDSEKVGKTTKINGYSLNNDINLSKSDVGLSNVDNTSDINKPISTNQQTALNAKVDKTITITAGAGLTGGGDLSSNKTINIASANDGITVNADDIQLNTIDNLTATSTTKPLSANQGKTLQDNKAEKTRNIVAGDGLSGGGDLSADRTINIANADDSLVVAADSVKVNTNNTLTSTSTTQPLSANQGKILNETKVPTSRTVNGYSLSSNVSLTKSDIGLSNVSNLAPADLPISTATQTALNSKVNTSRQVIAGAGLTGGGALTSDLTLNVVSGNDGISVSADAITLNTVNNLISTSTTQPLSAAQGKALNDDKVPNDRTVTAGNGLTGGGALSANITLNVVSANDAITVNADNIQLNTINTLTDTSTTKPLSAVKGKELNDRIIPFENAFAFEGTGTEADPYKVRVNYSIYSVGDIIGSGSGGAGAIYECSDAAIASYNSSTTASKALAAGDVLIFDGTHWRNVENNTSVVNGLNAIITELRRLASATNNGLMSSSDFNKLNNVTTYVSTLGAVTTSATNNTITVTTYNPATGTDTTTTLTFPTATTSLAGLLSATDKAKLDGIAAGANNYTHPNSGVTAGTYKSVTVNAAGHVTAGTNPTTLSGYGITDAAPSSHVGATGTEHGVATTSVNGFMSSTDKTKLDGVATGANNYVHPTTHSADILVDGTTNKVFTATEKTKLSGIATGAQVNVQSDWNAASGDAFILNKPTTVSGYGITDTYTKTQVDTSLSGKEPTITAGTTAQYWRGDKSWQALNKAAVGLSSVENTELSTWAGSTNISTVGTITNGTWSGSAIGISKGGTNLTALGTANQLLRVNASATALEYFTPAWPSVSFGEPTSQYSPLSINSVSRNLSLDGHTHSSFLNLELKNIQGGDINHRLELGFSGRDYVNWYEYGGLWKFIQKQDTVETELFKITPSNIFYKDNTIWHAGNFDPSSYIPKSGGQLTGQLGLLQGTNGGLIFPNDSFGGGGDSASIKLLNPIGGESTEMTFTMTNDADDIINFSVPSIDGVKVNRYTVWHAGNFNPSNYLSSFGGTLSGVLYTDSQILFNNNTLDLSWGGYINGKATINGNGGLNIYPLGNLFSGDVTINGHKVWHAGNDGAGSRLDADLLDGRQGIGFTNNYSDLETLNLNFDTIDFGGSNSSFVARCESGVLNPPIPYVYNWSLWQQGNTFRGSQMAIHAYGSGTGMYVRSSNGDTNTWNSWRTVAFTDSNVASATKLQNTRTIWGQSFNGEGDVTGNLTIPDTNTLGVAKLNTSGYSTMAFNSRAWHTAQGVNGKAFVFTTHTNTGGGGYESLIINYGESGSILLKPTGDGNVGIGTQSPSHKLDVNGNVNATRFFSTQATGTSPFTVSSATLVSNLNADLLDGFHNREITARALVRRDFSNIDDAMATNTDYGISQWSGWSSSITNGISGGYNVGLSVCGVDSTKYGFQLGVTSNASSDRLYYKGWSYGANTGWKGLAFLTDNVASATKLANIRYLWGNAFTGEGDVTGRITFSNYDTHIVMPIGYIGCNIGDSYFWNASNHPIKFGTNDLERMRIAPTGNVLIGTSTDAAYKLDVNGTSRITGALDIQSGYPSLSFLTTSGTNFRFTNRYTGNRLSIDNASTSTELVNILSDGKVGIGTNNPQYKLDVNGTSRFTSQLYVQSTITVDNWIYTNAGYGLYNTTFNAGIGFDTNNIVRTYGTNKFNVYNTDVDSITTLGGIYAIKGVIGVGRGSDFDSGGFEVRGNGSENTVFPTIGFHQPGLYASSIQLRSGGNFYFYQQGASGLANINAQVGTFSSDVNSSASGNFAVNVWAGNAIYTDGRIFTGYDANIYNSISCSNWFRSNGATGWFNDTYGGGIYMEDETYVKVYNSKSFKVNSTTADSINTSGGILAGGLRVAQTDGGGKGISLYDASYDSPQYGLMFAQTVYKGAHGAVNGDWATYFTMSTDAGRGWIFTSNAAGTGGNVASISNTGNLYCTGSGTFTGGGFNSLRNLKIIHDDWYGSSIEVINKFKIRDFNYKNQVDYNRTLGFIIDEVPVEVADYVLMGENRDSVNLYSLHALSFKAHQETKSEIDLLKEKIKELNNRIKMLENGLE